MQTRLKIFPFGILLWLLLFLTACTSNQPLTVTHPAVTVQPSSEMQPTVEPAATSTDPAPTQTPEQVPTATPVPQPGLPSIGDPYAPELGNSGYDIQHYHLQFRLDPGRAYVDAQAELTVTSRLPALDRLSLDFTGYEISSLLVDGQPVEFEREADKLWINLPEPLFSDQTATLQIEYQGEPPTTASSFVPFVGHLGLYFPGGAIFSLSEPDGAHHWFPANNHPLDKATFSMDITVPDGYTAVSNGTLQQQVHNNDGKTTFMWQHPYPMAPYLAMLAVGPYELIEDRSPGGIPIRHYVYPDRKEEFLLAVAETGEALDWMADLYGPYPFEAFGFATTRLVSFASETQTMVILPETSLNQETVLHEIAHMWFGDWVSLSSWSDMWLKEGAAIYTYLLWQTRDNPQALDYFMQERISRLQANPSGYALNALPRSHLLGTDTYWRGAAVYHALRLEIGDQAFFVGLRDFVQQFGGRNATLDDFIGVMEAASGQDLAEFFTLWVATP